MSAPSPPSPPPPVATAEQACALREDLTAGGWGVESTRRLLGPVADDALRREIRLPALRAVRAALADSRATGAALVLHHADGTDAAPQVLHRPGAQQVFFQLCQRQRERTQLVGFGHQPLAALDDGIQPAPAEHGQNGEQRHRHQQLDEREAGSTARRTGQGAQHHGQRAVLLSTTAKPSSRASRPPSREPPTVCPLWAGSKTWISMRRKLGLAVV